MWTSVVRTVFVLLLSSFLAIGSSQARAAESVLYLGDSLSMGSFGRTLDMRLREAGLEVYTVVAGGASPYYWLQAYPPISSSIGFWKKTPASEQRLGYVKEVPKLENLIDSYHPDVVVVQTGVNLYATLRSKRRPKAENVREVTNLIDQMCQAVSKAGARHYWILPPDSHESRYPRELQNELATLMTTVVHRYKGEVFESQKFTHFTDPYPATDGIHYGPTEAQAWAEKVASDFGSFLKVRKSFFARDEQKRPAAPLVAEVVSTRSDAGSQSLASANTATSLVPLKARIIRFDSGSPDAAPAVTPQPETSSVPTKPAEADQAPETKKKPDAAVSSPGSETPVTPAETQPETQKRTEMPAPGSGPEPATWEPVGDGKVDLELRLLGKSRVKNMSDVPYENALGVFEYEVVRVNSGVYPYDRIRVAHMVVWNRKETAPNRFAIDRQLSLSLVPLSRYPRLQQMYVVDDLRPNFELPLYICALD